MNQLIVVSLWLQNIHSKRVACKILFLNGLGALMRKPRLLAGAFLTLYFNYKWLEITALQSICSLFLFGYVCLGLDMRFCLGIIDILL